MFISRERKESPHLEWRIRLFAGAAVLALIGMYTEASLVIWGAIALLGVAFALRFVPVAHPSADPQAEAESPEHE